MSKIALGPQLTLQIAEARFLNPSVRCLLLRPANHNSSSLPGFTAGAHIGIQVRLANGDKDWRQYSLINLNPLPDATSQPVEYLVAIRLESEGRGGSRYLHEQVKVGDYLKVKLPRNDFPLAPGSGRIVLLAGGIGVTPLTSMAAHCVSEGRHVTMHYAGRQRTSMALLPELQSLLGENLHVHADDESAGPLDLNGLLDRCGPLDQVYVCGPQSLLDAVLAQVQARQWEPGRVRFELFAAPASSENNCSFDVVLSSSGQRLTVPPNKTVLAVLNEAGCDVMFDCERGECGVCAVEVLEGVVDHRDYVLSELERLHGRVMHACVSRSKGGPLVLKM